MTRAPRSGRSRALPFALVALAAVAAPLHAEEPAPAPSPSPTPPPIEVTGFVDTYYAYNTNRVDPQLHNFDIYHNTLSIGLADLDFTKKVTTDSRFGFQAELTFGPTTDTIHSFEPLPTGVEVYKHILQAYGSVLVGSKVQMDMGKFVTPLGAEVIQARDDWNYTRSLLFALAIPYYHVGLRAGLPVNDKVSLTAWLVNGWNNSTENNSGKSVGLGGTVKPTSSLTWVANMMYGPEQPNDDHDKRFVLDTTLTWTATPKLSLMANYDYGKDTYSGVGVSWQGLAVYGRFQATSWWALVGRYEWLNDDDAFMTGTSQKLRELTITSEQKVGPLITRLEYRRDHSSTDFFQTESGTPSQSQNTFIFGAIVNFAGKI